MYRGFKVDLSGWFPSENNYNTGLDRYKKNSEELIEKLEELLQGTNQLNGSDIQKDWFPLVKVDVFISHSHSPNDKKQAIEFAGWLWDKFKLRCFIDSQIWGYADELLMILDNKYCKFENQELYDYNKRNYSTSHVHMMLATAIAMMIEATECLFVMDTENSIKFFDQNKKEVEIASPWIYFELLMTKLLRRRELTEQRKNIFEFKDFTATYRQDIGHLNNLSSFQLHEWEINYQDQYSPLDVLYRLNPEPKTEIILESEFKRT